MTVSGPWFGSWQSAELSWTILQIASVLNVQINFNLQKSASLRQQPTIHGMSVVIDA